MNLKEKITLIGLVDPNQSFQIKDANGQVIHKGLSDSCGVIFAEIDETSVLLEHGDKSRKLIVNDVGMCSFQDSSKNKIGLRRTASKSMATSAGKFIAKQLISGAISKVGSDSYDKIMRSIYGPDETQTKLNAILNGQQQIRSMVEDIQIELQDSFNYLNDQFERLFDSILKGEKDKNALRVICLIDFLSSVENTLLSDRYVEFWDLAGNKYETNGKSEEEIIKIYSMLWSDLAVFGASKGFSTGTFGTLEYLLDKVVSKTTLDPNYNLSAQMIYFNSFIGAVEGCRNKEIIRKEFKRNAIGGINLVPNSTKAHEKEEEIEPLDGLSMSFLYTGYLQYLHIGAMITELNFIIINFGAINQYKSVNELIGCYKDTTNDMNLSIKKKMGLYGWPDVSLLFSHYEGDFQYPLLLVEAAIMDNTSLPTALILAYEQKAVADRKKCFSHIQQMFFSAVIPKDQRYTKYHGFKAEYMKGKTILSTYYAGISAPQNNELFVLTS